MIRWGALLLVGSSCLLAGPAENPPAKLADPVAVAPTPAQAQARIVLPPGWRIELAAAEPEIESPVAAVFDEDGRLWVVEMGDYPNGPAPGQPPQGRIKVLEDRDQDGRFETSRVFADQLLFANGVLPWKGGAIVTAAPHILYLKDTDGDGKADQREVLYEGFAAQNPQLRVSHPILAIDNWIYVANGLRGGKIIRAGKAGAEPIDLSGMDFRFDPIKDRAEAISGMGQFGNTFDDWGNRFVCDNRHHLRHVVFPNRYLKRNPYLALPAVLEDISEIESSQAGSGAVIYPLSKNWTTSNLHAGRFTAACGVFIYRGTLLPEEYRGAAFTCDPTGNLVHVESMKPHGATFRSKPLFDQKEFLASPDDWFRPVSLAEGPEGCLYVVDMCRAVIEHPEFMPTELKNRPDLMLGKDKGRIWRIVPPAKGVNHPPLRPQLSKASTEELVKFLEHPAGWWRTTAQRLLLERQDRKTISPLRELVLSSPSMKARVHAAWLLESAGALEQDHLLSLLKVKDRDVIRHAAQLVEPFLAKSKDIREQLIKLADDPTLGTQVGFQLALTLGQLNIDSTAPVVIPMVGLLSVNDPWVRWAVASAPPDWAWLMASFLLDHPDGLTKEITPNRLLFLQELATVVGSNRDPADTAVFLRTLLALDCKGARRWQLSGLSGLADGLARRGTRLSDFIKKFSDDYKDVSTRVKAMWDLAGSASGDKNLALAERLEAIRLLSHAPEDIAGPLLRRLVQNDAVPELRLAAVRAFAGLSSPDTAKVLMESWSTYGPGVRREVIEAMLRQPDRTLFLLGELEAKRLVPGDLDALATRRLLNHTRADIREQAGKLLKAALPEERKLVLERYQEALTIKGDAAKGRELFRQHCGNCHKIAGVGVQVGPDISDTRTKTPEMLLGDILNPNAAIDANFVNYLVVLKSGKSATGLIAAETASSVTLKRAENQTETLLRQDIEEMRSSGQSLMTEGMEKVISVPQMADLIAFLKNWRYLDGAVPVGPR